MNKHQRRAIKAFKKTVKREVKERFVDYSGDRNAFRLLASFLEPSLQIRVFSLIFSGTSDCWELVEYQTVSVTLLSPHKVPKEYKILAKESLVKADD